MSGGALAAAFRFSAEGSARKISGQNTKHFQLLSKFPAKKPELFISAGSLKKRAVICPVETANGPTDA